MILLYDAIRIRSSYYESPPVKPRSSSNYRRLRNDFLVYHIRSRLCIQFQELYQKVWCTTQLEIMETYSYDTGKLYNTWEEVRSVDFRSARKTCGKWQTAFAICSQFSCALLSPQTSRDEINHIRCISHLFRGRQKLYTWCGEVSVKFLRNFLEWNN